MKKIIFRVLLAISVAFVTLQAITETEMAVMMEQVKNDKTLQEKLKQEASKYSKTKTNTTDKLKYNLDVNQTNGIDNNISLQNDLNSTKDINRTKPQYDENGREIYTIDNYYKNFTPFFYEDQINLVEEIEKKQIKQYTNKKIELKRYGVKFFEYNLFNNTEVQLITSGVPDDYILQTGDTLHISVYGLSDYQDELEVNKDGKVVIAQVGSMSVRGMNYKSVRNKIYSKLKSTFPNTSIDISIGKTNPFTVSVIGEVKKPGLYTVNALSKVKDALSIAQGITDIGSMRNIEIRRNGKVVTTFDLYELIKGSKDNGDILLSPGDIVYVPTAQNLITLDGNIKNPGIFELKEKETLKDLLSISGGLNSDASKTINIYRNTNGTRTLFEAKPDEKIVLKNGDKIIVGTLSDVIDNQVFLLGNIYNNDSISILKNDTVGSLLKRLINYYGKEKVFMSNTNMNYFLVKRIDKNTLEPKILSGNLSEALNGNKALDVELQSEDKIFIFNNFMTEDIKYVSVNGEVLRKGKFKFFSGMKLIDALMVAGTMKESDLNKIKVTSVNSKNNAYEIKYYSNEEASKVLLNPYDDINISNFTINADFEKVTINGAVLNPETYNYSTNMTINDLINMSGGLKQNANLEHFELVRYVVKNGVREHTLKLFNLKNAMDENLVLLPYDEVMIRSISEWGDSKSVELKGEVHYPGIYTIMPGEKLSSVIKRAGGFTKSAFLEGAVFTREDIKKLQEDAFKRQLDDLESSMLYMATQPEEAGSKTQSSAELLQVLDSIRKRGEETEMVGRLSVRLENDLEKFANSPYDIVLKAGDTLTIPEQEQSVAIMGEVMNTTAVTQVAGMSLWDYIDQAGGLKQSGDEEGIFVVKANGEAKRVKKYFLIGYVVPKIEAGDTIVVPFNVNRFSGLKFAKDITGIIYQIAVSAAALKTVGAL